MKFKYFLSILLLSSCSKVFESPEMPAGYLNLPMVRNVDPALNSIVSKFEQEFGVAVYYTVYFVPILQDNAAGKCWRWHNGERYVQIDPAYFKSINPVRQEQLIFHELGHCSLNLEHVSDTVVFTGLDPAAVWPSSIMNPASFNDSQAKTYELQRQYYLNQMRGML